MKRTLLIALFSAMMLDGCARNEQICVPPSPPKFNTAAFKHKDDIRYKYWVDKIDDNTTIIVQDPADFYRNIEEIKLMKSDYNMLLDGINNFNKDLNTTQKD